MLRHATEAFALQELIMPADNLNVWARAQETSTWGEWVGALVQLQDGTVIALRNSSGSNSPLIPLDDGTFSIAIGFDATISLEDLMRLGTMYILGFLTGETTAGGMPVTARVRHRNGVGIAQRVDDFLVGLNQTFRTFLTKVGCF